MAPPTPHAGVSQPAVSQYLASLRENGDAVFVNPGWLPVRDRLPATYHSCYSSRFTEQAAWYRIDAVSGQELGFVPADSASTASVLVRPIPDDRFVREAEQLRNLRVAPRLHLIADLIGLGGDDRVEAAARFTDHQSSPL